MELACLAVEVPPQLINLLLSDRSLKMMGHLVGIEPVVKLSVGLGQLRHVVSQDVSLHTGIGDRDAQRLEAPHVEPPLVQRLMDGVHGHCRTFGPHTLQCEGPVTVRARTGVHQCLEQDVGASDRLCMQQGLLHMLGHHPEDVPPHVALHAVRHRCEVIGGWPDLTSLQRRQREVRFVGDLGVPEHDVPPGCQLRVAAFQV